MSDDLVQRLRLREQLSETYAKLGGDSEIIFKEAADRIEALERWLDGYRTSVESNDRRIEALEAALREIAELHVAGDNVTADIARRALEGKP